MIDRFDQWDWKGLARDVALDLRRAGAFLTRLPVTPAGDAPDDDARARSLRVYPLVGAVIGGVAGLALLAAFELRLAPLACGFIAVGIAALLTGALHEDGLADFADGLGAGRDRDKALAVMRDARIGAFGVLALVVGVGLRAALIAGIAGPGLAAAALIAAHASSRAFFAYTLHLVPSARADGLARAAGRPDRATALVALGVGAAVLLVSLGWQAAGIALVWGAAAAALVAWFAARRLGGVTGDALGAQQQVAEIAVLAVATGMLP